MTDSQTTGVTTYTLKGDRELIFTRVVKAPQRLVFDVYTVPEHVKKWLLGLPGWDMTVCEIDLRVGGKWRYAWSKEGGGYLEMTGVYKEVVPPEKVVQTESWGPEWPDTINTVSFSESNGYTTITTSLLYPSHEARENALKTGMKEGMEHTFAYLDSYLAELQ